MLEVRKLSRSFGGVQALADVSLSARPGEVTGVIGPNGAGKSTLLSCISGWLLPDSGIATFEGISLLGVPPAELADRGCIRTFQNLELLDESSVHENIGLGTRRTNTTGLVGSLLRTRRARQQLTQADDVIREAAERLGLSALLTMPAGGLSYGQRKQLELARAFAAAPSLLLLDEPAAGLDDFERHKLSTLITAVADQGVTVVLVEHAIEMVMALSSQIVVLDFGAVITQGTPTQVRADPEVIEAYLGRSA